jgi:hypothetical protein
MGPKLIQSYPPVDSKTRALAWRLAQTAYRTSILNDGLYTSPAEKQGKFVRIIAFCGRIG